MRNYELLYCVLNLWQINLILFDLMMIIQRICNVCLVAATNVSSRTYIPIKPVRPTSFFFSCYAVACSLFIDVNPNILEVLVIVPIQSLRSPWCCCCLINTRRHTISASLAFLCTTWLIFTYLIINFYLLLLFGLQNLCYAWLLLLVFTHCSISCSFL